MVLFLSEYVFCFERSGSVKRMRILFGIERVKSCNFPQSMLLVSVSPKTSSKHWTFWVAVACPSLKRFQDHHTTSE